MRPPPSQAAFGAHKNAGFGAAGTNPPPCPPPGDHEDAPAFNTSHRHPAKVPNERGTLVFPPSDLFLRSLLEHTAHPQPQGDAPVAAPALKPSYPSQAAPNPTKAWAEGDAPHPRAVKKKKGEEGIKKKARKELKSGGREGKGLLIMSPAQRSPGRLLRRRIPLPSRCGPLQVAAVLAAAFPLFPAVPQALSRGSRSKVGSAPYGREKSPPRPPRNVWWASRGARSGWSCRSAGAVLFSFSFFFFLLIIPSFFQGCGVKSLKLSPPPPQGSSDVKAFPSLPMAFKPRVFGEHAARARALPGNGEIQKVH